MGFQESNCPCNSVSSTKVLTTYRVLCLPPSFPTPLDPCDSFVFLGLIRLRGLRGLHVFFGQCCRRHVHRFGFLLERIAKIREEPQVLLCMHHLPMTLAIPNNLLYPRYVDLAILHCYRTTSCKCPRRDASVRGAMRRGSSWLALALAPLSPSLCLALSLTRSLALSLAAGW